MPLPPCSKLDECSLAARLIPRIDSGQDQLQRYVVLKNKVPHGHLGGYQTNHGQPFLRFG